MNKHISYLYTLSLIGVFLHVIGVVVAVIAWILDLPLPMQSVPITTEVGSSNPAQARCTQYSIKFVNDLRQVSSFLQALWFPLPIKLTVTI